MKLTLTQRLAIVFAVLLLLCSGMSAWLQVRSNRMHELEVVQALSRDVAESIARDVQLTDANGLMPNAVAPTGGAFIVLNGQGGRQGFGSRPGRRAWRLLDFRYRERGRGVQPNSLLEVRKSRSSSAGEATPAALASALLRARDVAEIAAIGVLHAELRFGLQHARVVWSAALPHLAASPTRSVPEDVLRSRKQILVQGLETPGSTELAQPDVRTSAVPLVPRGIDGWAGLLYDLPQGAARPEGADWELFRADLARALAAALRAERLQLSVERLEKAEQLQRALYAIADMASSDLDMPDMLKGIHEIVGTLMYSENFFIVLYSEANQTLRFIYFRDTVDLVNH